jgi:creatinine amidohydrolase
LEERVGTGTVASSTTSSSDASRFLLHEISRGESAARAGEALLILPIGATEQHGPHLPLGTDFLIVEHVARAATQAARQATGLDVLVAPTLPFGSSHHHLPFGGTVSLASERYFAALRDMVASLIQGGFRRIFLLNGHGGNHELMQVVVRDLALEHPVNLGAASYWDLAREAVIASGLLNGMLPGHAGVFETSLILALRPELVANPLPHRDEVELARVAIPRTPFRAERAGFWESIDGFTDSPDQASAELGQRLLATVVPPVADAFASFAGLALLNRESPDTRHPTPDTQ